MSWYVIGFLFGVMVATMLFLAAGCKTTTSVCLDCPYGSLEYNRTMDTAR